ncbi:RNA polymerase-binding protein RbpA [Actinokineospora cianjurensis]|uniref:RNA polymerase binding protein RbpA n=1 Tax=Actinokineospora cianjurensis TaxID=585224 RepID=A0A421B214_9PSEU|nr:RNA polymerase-binding protein RbpA [Actinokineospora cianjurensis]RLK58410.1 RNA polymerase binding protein RbpA [Actinokineospora cianjurensis]
MYVSGRLASSRNGRNTLGPGGIDRAADELAPRRDHEFLCPRGHSFTRPLAADLPDGELPARWRCPQHGVDAARAGVDTPAPAPLEQGRPRIDKTPWQMLLERRTIADLDALLDRQLRELRCRRGGGPSGGVEAVTR